MFLLELKFQLSTIPLEYKTLFSIKTGFCRLISNADRKRVQILGGDINVSLKLGIGFCVSFLMALFLHFVIFPFLCRHSRDCLCLRTPVSYQKFITTKIDLTSKFINETALFNIFAMFIVYEYRRRLF